MASFAVELLQKINDAAGADLEIASFKGCTDQEIQNLMEAQKVDSLPQVYIEFMKGFGKDAGGFMQGSYFKYEDAVELKQDMIDEFSNDDNWKELVPNDAFVFFCHQGYHYAFFLTSTGEPDPPVYNIIEGRESYQVNEQLSQFILAGIK